MEINKDVVYFELNNWFSGRDYPNAEPFITWICENKFSNDEWLKENKLVCVKSYVDMSQNFCVTASRQWVEEHCPLLLSDTTLNYIIIRHSWKDGKEVDEQITYAKPYKDFLRSNIEDAKFGYFLDYEEENFGLHINDGEDYDLWNHDEED